MRRSVISFFLLLLTATAFAGETQRYFVGTRTLVSDDAGIRRLYRDADPQAQPRAVTSYRNFKFFAADLTEEEVAALKSSPQVSYVEPVVEVRAFTPPVRNYNGQTVPIGIDAVKARDAWAAGRGLGTNVAILDTGIDYHHPDLKNAFAGGEDFVNSDLDPMDDAGHGSHVSGTIAAADDQVGVVGIAPGVKLWGLKVLNAAGTGTNDKLIKALDWVISKKKEIGGNWVINMSLGHEGVSVSERSAVQRVIDAGIIVAAASGNESTTSLVKPVSYPAAYNDVLAVGAVDSTQAIASFSNQGPELDLVAPGVSVLSSVPVGLGFKTYVGEANDLYWSSSVNGSPEGSISGEYVYCGIGGPNDFPASVRGKIALIQRDTYTFAWKSRRAKEAGAIAVVIFDSAAPARPGLNWTMRPDPDNPTADDTWMASFEYLLTINMVHADGLALSKKTGASLTAVNQADDYDVYNGTSMATPHVAGAAALVWSLAPNATAAQVKAALTSTAKDLGNSGPDATFGFGLVDVFAAAKALAPNAFLPPVETNPKPTTGRTPGRRR